MTEACEACGLERWFANTPEHFDPKKHCLAHSGADIFQQKRDCEQRELTRLRTENASLREKLTKLEQLLQAAMTTINSTLGDK